MTSENNKGNEDHQHSELGEIGNRVRYIQRTVSEIGSQLDDHYHLIRGIYDATTQNDGADWYDLCE